MYYLFAFIVVVLLAVVPALAQAAPGWIIPPGGTVPPEPPSALGLRDAVPWPSISPSYHCDDGLAVFVLYNVGTDMGNGAPYTVSTPRRIIEQGFFWLAAGGHTEYWYNAPGIPLTFAYVRPDNYQQVSMTQTCGDVPVAGTQEHRIYAPIMLRYCELVPAVTP